MIAGNPEPVGDEGGAEPPLDREIALREGPHFHPAVHLQGS